MSDQELKDIWQHADDGKHIHLNSPELMKQLNGKMKKIDRVLFFRDAREIVAAGLVMVFFGYEAFTEELPLVRIVYLLIISWCMYVIYRLLDVRKYKKISNLSDSLKAQLTQQKMYLQQQAHLLNSALYWYVAPPAVLGIAAILGRSYTQGFDWGSIALSTGIILVVSWGIYLLNKRAAKKAYTPLITNIDQVLVQLRDDTI